MPAAAASRSSSGGGGGSGSGPRYAPEDPTLPKPWKELIDGATGYHYFWNPETNVTQYDRPASLPPPPPPGPPPHRDRKRSADDRDRSRDRHESSKTSVRGHGATEPGAGGGGGASAEAYRRQHEISITVFGEQRSIMRVDGSSKLLFRPSNGGAVMEAAQSPAPLMRFFP